MALIHKIPLSPILVRCDVRMSIDSDASRALFRDECATTASSSKWARFLVFDSTAALVDRPACCVGSWTGIIFSPGAVPVLCGFFL